MSNDLMLAILAMASYNRNGDGLNVTVSQVGAAGIPGTLYLIDFVPSPRMTGELQG
jgi:hypothetical protein